MDIILGSSSIYRKTLLEKHGFVVESCSPDIDESAIRHPDSLYLVQLLAQAKANAIIQRGAYKNGYLVCANSVVSVKGIILEKPKSREELIENFTLYANHPCVLVTGLCVVDLATGKKRTGVDTATIYYSSTIADDAEKLAEQDIFYTTSGGAKFDDPMQQKYITFLDGDMSTVIGAPIHLIKQAIAEFQGIPNNPLPTLDEKE